MSHAAWLLAAACVLSSGCSTYPNRGELGVAQFAWDEGAFGCLFGCTVRGVGPMAAHASAGLLVTNVKTLPKYSAASGDADVLALGNPSGSPIGLSSRAAGDAMISLIGTDGALIDRLPIHVRDVIDIGVDDVDVPSQKLTIMIGGDAQLEMTLYGEGREKLKGAGALEYEYQGNTAELPVTLTSAFADLITSIFAGSVDEYVKVKALALGEGQVIARSPAGASLTIPTRVVDESAVDRVILDDNDGTPVGQKDSISAKAFAGADPVHSPKCSWSISPTDGPIKLTSPQRYTALAESSVPATATVTCTVGAASASRQIVFH